VDRARKLPAYAREGVRHAWLIDPQPQTLEVLRLEGGHWSVVLTAAADEGVRAEPFDAIELELGALWER
jgi:Uma2 family endonuclease